MENIINKIKSIRSEKGISHDAMAYSLGISQVAYSKIEKSETKLTVERLLKIAEILNTDIHDFFGNSNKISIQNQTNNEGAYGNGYVENLYTDNNKSYEKLIQSKDDQIAFLKSLLEKENL